MAKRIKPIKCPQCGSTKATELRADYYRCNSCSTEFFLDSDDINIYHHNKTNPQTPDPAAIKKIAFGFVGFACFFLLVTILPGMCRKKSSVSSKISEKQFSNGDAFFMETANKKPVYIIAGIRRSTNSKSNPVYVGFYDAISKKEIKMVELPVAVDRFNARFRYFSNGDLYFIINEKIVCTINRQSLDAAVLSPQSYSSIPELVSGFAKVGFSYEDVEDAFRVLTNAGQELIYYPALGKVLTSTQRSAGLRDGTLANPDAAMVTGFCFSSFSSHQSGAITQLIKFNRKYSPGYPTDDPTFEWQQDEKTAIQTNYSQDLTKISDYADFSPGRLYFNPQVLDYNDKVLLISFKPTPAEDEKYSVQAIDANTGKILWTYAVTDDSKMYSSSSGLITGDGYFVDFGRQAVFFDKNGKLISEKSYYDYK